MTVDCLFQVCNGRVRSATSNFVAIGKLHARKVPWCKVFLLLDLYLSNIPEVESDKGQSGRTAEPAMSQQTVNSPVFARKVDDKGIAELAKERKLLDRVAVFFAATVKHYRIESSVAEGDEDIGQGAVIVANARLMQGLGRTLNRVMDALVRHKREEKKRRRVWCFRPLESTYFLTPRKTTLLELSCTTACTKSKRSMRPHW